MAEPPSRHYVRTSGRVGCVGRVGDVLAAVLAGEHRALRLIVPGDVDATDVPALDVAGGQHREGTLCVLLGDDGDHTDTHVEGLVHLLLGDLAEAGDGAGDRQRRLRHVALRGGPGEDAGVDDGEELAEVVAFDHRPHL